MLGSTDVKLMGVKLKPCLSLKVIQEKWWNRRGKQTTSHHISWLLKQTAFILFFLTDPPRFNSDDLAEFMKPITIKTGKDAAFKLTFVGSEPMKIQWYHDGEELVEDTNVKIEKSSSHSRLHLTKCQRKASGEIKIKVKNQWGTNEAITQLTVLGTISQLDSTHQLLIHNPCNYLTYSM